MSPTFSHSADLGLTPLYLLCFLVGVPGNVLALRYFLKQRPALSIILFALTAALDLVTVLVICIPTVYTLVNYRRAGWYENYVVCAVLGTLFNWISHISVFLLTMLSFSRTYLLVFPLRRQNKTASLWFMAVYMVLVTCHETLFAVAGKLVFKYDDDEAYCWDKGVTKWWSRYDDIFDMALLAVPIVPVSVSCVITCYKVVASSSANRKSFLNSPVKRNATITIMLYTLSYLLFSLPNFVNYVAWAVVKIMDKGSSARLYNNSSFMKYYSWLLTDTLLLVVISTINPLILLARTQKYTLVSIKSPPPTKSKSKSNVNGYSYNSD